MDCLSWSTGTVVVSAIVDTFAIAPSKSMASFADAPRPAAAAADIGISASPTPFIFSPADFMDSPMVWMSFGIFFSSPSILFSVAVTSFSLVSQVLVSFAFSPYACLDCSSILRVSSTRFFWSSICWVRFFRCAAFFCCADVSLSHSEAVAFISDFSSLVCWMISDIDFLYS